jgi:hypothetical protein
MLSQNMHHIMTQQTKDSWLLPWMLVISSIPHGAYGNCEVGVSWQNDHTSLSMAALLHRKPAFTGTSHDSCHACEVIRETWNEQYTAPFVRNWDYIVKISVTDYL